MNLLAVLRAMGVECDQEVVALVGAEPAFIPLLQPSLHECKSLGIFTQQQALEFLGACKGCNICKGPGPEHGMNLHVRSPCGGL